MASFQGVEEIPGLYGSLRIEEKVIQQIWADQDFNDLELHTECGKRLIISNPGIWNRAEEGPDFKNASLSIDQLKQGIKKTINNYIYIYINLYTFGKKKLTLYYNIKYIKFIYLIASNGILLDIILFLKYIY